jgi:predicted phage terminase large subunit-like protein
LTPAPEEAIQGRADAEEQSREGSKDGVGGPDFFLEEPSLGANLDEIIQLGAVDPLFYNQCWFPKTFRQPAASFHPAIYEMLDNPANRYINIQVMRDGAKTTILRSYSARRISYGLSRTILYVAQSETKAKQSVGWIKHQVETNTKWASTFGLQKGKPWSEEHICILHGVEQHKVHILAFGITGGLRGVNLDDWRPDLIVVDDAISDENASSPEQRDKIKNLVFGAIKESLARRSEAPHAKLVILNTPLDFDDLSETAKKDLQFVSASFGCWTEETKYLDIDDQESSWPEAYPSEELRAEKRAAIATNRYSIFAREKEVNLLVAEDCAFRSDWLQFYGSPGDDYLEVNLDEAWVEMAIDPVPPPTDKQIAEGLKKKDYESIAVACRWKGKFFLLDQVHNRGHDPAWTIHTIFDLARRWRVRKIIVEAVGYQKVLEWLLKEAMRKTGRYWLVEPFDDKRKKYNRITDALVGPASEGALYVKRTHTAFINQFTHFGGKNPEGQHDDDLEAAAVVIHSLHKGYVGDVAEDWYAIREAQIPDLRDYRGAP